MLERDAQSASLAGTSFQARACRVLGRARAATAALNAGERDLVRVELEVEVASVLWATARVARAMAEAIQTIEMGEASARQL